MKRYIFLTPSITNMGGSEMYTYNKWRYLSAHGWDVDIYFFNQTGRFMLKDLEIYKDNCIPDLIFRLSYFSKKDQEKILNRILFGVSFSDEVVVESHLFSLSLWGELIAGKTSGKSILNCMEEDMGQISKKEAQFVEYKLKRHEILNATSKALHRYFGCHYKEEFEQYSHSSMKAFCSNVVTHTVVSDVAIAKADFNILSVGRLEKPYVLPSFVEVRKFVETHRGNSFNMVIIGGDPKGEVEGKIRSVFSGVNNVNIVFLGYMYPIPSNLITMNDVAIASVNSVLVPSNEGVPTIVIDINDYKPVGIYGITTKSKISRSTEPQVTIAELLDDVLIKKLYPKMEPIVSDEEAELEEVFGKQVNFLKMSPNDGVAYPVGDLYSFPLMFINRIKKLIHHLGF